MMHVPMTHAPMTHVPITHVRVWRAHLEQFYLRWNNFILFALANVNNSALAQNGEGTRSPGAELENLASRLIDGTLSQAAVPMARGQLDTCVNCNKLEIQPFGCHQLSRRHLAARRRTSTQSRRRPAVKDRYISLCKPAVAGIRTKKRHKLGRNRRQPVPLHPSLPLNSVNEVEMADLEDADATQTDKISASHRDSVGEKLPSDHAATGSCDSGSKRVKWQTVVTWDPQDVEEQHIQDSILSNAREYMRGSGLSFVAGLKKKPTNLDLWLLKSKKIG